jgi:hypothetical protein
LGSETGFLLWVEEKARIRAFFFRARRFRFFSRSFFFALSHSFFRFALASAKKAPAPTSGPTKLVSFPYNRNRNRKKFRNYPKQKDLFRFFWNIPKLERFGSFGSIKKEPKEPKGEIRRREMDGKRKEMEGKWKGN